MTEKEAEQFFIELWKGKHHFPSKLKQYGSGWCMNTEAFTLATYDNDALTQLVLMAHEKSIRVEIQSAGVRGIKIIIHKRKREGRMWERHPTITQAVENFA